MTVPRKGSALGTALTSALNAMVIFRRIKTRISIQTRRRRLSLPKLTDLPLEILVEVLCLLEWKDVLRIRQTCKRLRDASIARPVWLRLFQWYSATIQPRPFWPEKPLDLHANRELEYLILKWQSAKAGYTLAQAKKRQFSTSEPQHQSVHLVEGGRWLLFGTKNGSVKYFDLNAERETPEAVTLLPTHFNRDALTTAHLSIDMDADAEYLTFNLGIMSYPIGVEKVNPLPSRIRWIEVCRVTSHWNENGEVTGLRAERLACFREEYNLLCISFTLGGSHVAYSLCDLDPQFGNGESISVVDWRLPDSESLSYPRRLVCHHQAEWLALLPGDRLLCRYSEKFQLFDLKNAPWTTICPTQSIQRPSQPPLASLDLFVRATSRPYLVHNTVRFTVRTSQGVYGLIVHSGATLDCVKLLPYSDYVQSDHMSYDRAVVRFGLDTSVLQFAWPDGESSSCIKNTAHGSICGDIHGDLYSSRIVTCGEWLRIVSIFDSPGII